MSLTCVSAMSRYTPIPFSVEKAQEVVRPRRLEARWHPSDLACSMLPGAMTTRSILIGGFGIHLRQILVTSDVGNSEDDRFLFHPQLAVVEELEIVARPAFSRRLGRHLACNKLGVHSLAQCCASASYRRMALRH